MASGATTIQRFLLIAENKRATARRTQSCLNSLARNALLVCAPKICRISVPGGRSG